MLYEVITERRRVVARHRIDRGAGRRADPGPSADDPTGLKALWRLLDLFADQPPELLETVLAEAGVDVYRTGWVRLDPGGERVAATLRNNFV